MKILNALVLSSVVALGANSAFAGGHAERCMQAMDILKEAQVDPFVLDEIFMRSNPMPQLAGALFNGDIGAAEGFMDQVDQLEAMEDEDALLADMGIDRDQFDKIMDETDPLPEIADTFFSGDMAGAEDVMMALEATGTNPEMCAEFMMTNGEGGVMPATAGGAMPEGMAPPPECMPAFELAMQYNVDPMMMMMIDERVGDNEEAFLEEVARTFFNEDQEAAGIALNDLDGIVEANNLTWEMCMPSMPTNN